MVFPKSCLRNRQKGVAEAAFRRTQNTRGRGIAQHIEIGLNSERPLQEETSGLVAADRLLTFQTITLVGLEADESGIEASLEIDHVGPAWICETIP